MKKPHTALFVASTGVGKTQLVLNLLESEYFSHFSFIIIICPALKHNEMDKSRGWVWSDPDVILIEPDNSLYYLIEKAGKMLTGSKILFLIDDIIANENLDKQRNSLLNLAISGHHRGHSLWLLTQSYTAVPLNIRRQVKMLYVWYQKKRGDWDAVHEENDVIETQGEIANVKKKLRQCKHNCLIMRTVQPIANEIH